MRKSRCICLGVTLFVLTVMLVDPAFCEIANASIQAASRNFVSTLKDWVTPIIAAGLFGSGVCLFANNFRMGLAGLVGTGFLYAAKEFVGDGGAVLISMAGQLL